MMVTKEERKRLNKRRRSMRRGRGRVGGVGESNPQLADGAALLSSSRSWCTLPNNAICN